jgi:hypothetical protein
MGLIGLFGGVGKFVEQLMEFFDYSSTPPALLRSVTTNSPGVARRDAPDLDQFNILPNPYYWAGNEVRLLDCTQTCLTW